MRTRSSLFEKNGGPRGGHCREEKICIQRLLIHFSSFGYNVI